MKIEEILAVKHLSVEFQTSDGKKQVVKDVSLSLRQGEVLALVGESGCGKSTLGRTIIHLQDSTDGQIIFDGKDVTKVDKNGLADLRNDMQIIFQDPFASLNPRMTVSEAIAAPLLVQKLFDRKDKEGIQKRVREIMDMVGLAGRLINTYPHELDGGRRQRIGIARALTVQPKLIIADEPVSALDVSIQAQVLNLLQNLQKEYNLTYLFISHDLSVVEMISDRIGVMYLGTIVETAPKKELYANPRHPYTRALLSAVPIPDPEVKKERITLKGDLPSPSNPPSGCLFHTRCPHCTEKCKTQVPTPVEIAPGHIVKCHYPKLTE